VFINPELVTAEGVAESEEGCLSVPGYYDKVARARAHHRTRRQNEHGHAVSRSKPKGCFAVCIQHEMDHLVGKVFVEYLSPFEARAASRPSCARSRKLAGLARRRAQSHGASGFAGHAGLRRAGARRPSQAPVTRYRSCSRNRIGRHGPRPESSRRRP